MDDVPDNRIGRVAWALAATTPDEVRRRYDAWAQQYDHDLLEIDHWMAPTITANTARRLLPEHARILDAACGTGLSGEALKVAGFAGLVGLDFASNMLDVARSKNIYDDVVMADLAARLPFDSESFDGVTLVGASYQAPPICYREFIRIAKLGGVILFTGDRDQFNKRGFAAHCGETIGGKSLALIEESEPFAALPASEPHMLYKVLAHRVVRQ